MANSPIRKLWEAMETLKDHGFKINKIIDSRNLDVMCVQGHTFIYTVGSAEEIVKVGWGMMVFAACLRESASSGSGMGFTAPFRSWRICVTSNGATS